VLVVEFVPRPTTDINSFLRAETLQKSVVGTVGLVPFFDRLYASHGPAVARYNIALPSFYRTKQF